MPCQCMWLAYHARPPYVSAPYTRLWVSFGYAGSGSWVAAIAAPHPTSTRASAHLACTPSASSTQRPRRRSTWMCTLPPRATTPAHLQNPRAEQPLRESLKAQPLWGALLHCLHARARTRLACDRIDISWMEHNVADRHNFFTKNFWMVSDIREIIVSGRRARLRIARRAAPDAACTPLPSY